MARKGVLVVIWAMWGALVACWLRLASQLWRRRRARRAEVLAELSGAFRPVEVGAFDVTMADGSRYRMAGGVWRKYPSAERCDDALVMKLSEALSRYRDAETEAKLRSFWEAERLK